jgi:hypothetical protein
LRHIYIYLFLRQKRGIMKATIYKGFTYVHCLFVVAGIGVEGSTFLYLGSSQIINDPPKKKKIKNQKNKKKPLLMQFLMPSFDLNS